ncbi:hypothetical protein VTL71DRAFT_10446 [Oculimacula yallundae]|uniref:Uncharacterized protein n=1 Tax=Oculimacula yallundae TaxID=86028 RepID=A0ABR4CTK3_9HELO
MTKTPTLYHLCLGCIVIYYVLVMYPSGEVYRLASLCGRNNRLAHSQTLKDVSSNVAATAAVSKIDYAYYVATLCTWRMTVVGQLVLNGARLDKWS